MRFGRCRGWRFLNRLWVLFVCASECRALQYCHTCDNDPHCMDGRCVGDYCYMGMYQPFRDQPKQSIKACINGSIVAKNIPDQCDAMRPLGQLLLKDVACMCSDSAYCNRALDGVGRRLQPLVKCYADDRQEQHYCYGHYCGLAMMGTYMARSCIHQALPLLEQNLMGACVQPPIFHSFHPVAQSLNNTMTCICGERKCNGRMPGEYQFFSRMQLCDVQYSMSVTAPGRLTTKYDIGKVPMCRGQFCFQMNMFRVDGTTNITSSISGCINYVRHWLRAQQLLPSGGTLSFESSSLKYRFVVWPYDQRMSNVSYTGADEMPIHDTSHLYNYENLAQTQRRISYAVPRLHYATSAQNDNENNNQPQDVSETSSTNDEDSMASRIRSKLRDMIIIIVAGVCVGMLIFLLGSLQYSFRKKLTRGSYNTVAAK